VIIKQISENFDFFALIKNAKKVNEKSYIANFKNHKYTITLNSKNEIEFISYMDEFENNVKIVFEKQVRDIKYKKEIFTPVIPEEYDIIRD